MSFVYGTLSFLQILSALVLIGITMSQSTKNEGLSGSIGGKTESAFSKPGFEEKLDVITRVCAITFMVISALVAFVVPK